MLSLHPALPLTPYTFYVALITSPCLNPRFQIFLSFTGGQIMDLAQRALIIQRSRHEREDQKGVLMVTVNLGWTWGNMIGEFFYLSIFVSSFFSPTFLLYPVVLPFHIRKHYTRWHT